MTVIRPNSISGVTSITALANEINVFRHNGVLAGLQLNGVNHHTSAGVSTFHTVNILGNLDVAGVLTYQDVTNVDSVGIITARQGIHIDDSITHIGDTDTKIRFPAADTISFETAGTQRLRIASDGKVLIDNSTGTLTIGGDNVYDSAKINLMVGSMSQTSATTEETVLVIHDQNSRRNGTESAGSWKSKIEFRSTQINGNSQSEGASIVHDITYNNYSSNKMRSDLVFKTRGDAQTSTSDAATEKLRIRHNGQVGIGTNNPQKKLEVFDATQGVIRIRGGAGGSNSSRKADLSLFASGAREYVVRADASDAAFKIVDVSGSNAERLIITSDGKIGINQTSPQTGLHINQDWVNSYGSISVEGSANVLVGLGLRSNGNYRGSLIWRDGSSGNYMDISTYGGAYPILFRPNGTEKVRINSNGDLGLLKIADNNTSSAGNHGFRFGSWGIQMRDTGGFNHWYIRRNYGGWQTSPQVTFKGNGYTGVNRLDPTHYLDVDGTSIFRDRIFSGTMSMKSIPFGANVTYDTGISINAYGYGGSILALCSRNYGAGTSTQAGLYFLEFKYDGNNMPTIHHVSGDNFVSFNKSASNTLTVNMGASNNNITMIESSVVNP